MSITQFKKEMGATSIEVKHNTATSKTFAQLDVLGEDGKNLTFKCQSDLNLKKPVSFMYTDDIKEGCIINPKETTVSSIGTL